MISSAEFAAYNREVAGIGDRAASDVESSVLAWCRSHEDATVAEKREAAKAAAKTAGAKEQQPSKKKSKKGESAAAVIGDAILAVL